MPKVEKTVVDFYEVNEYIRDNIGRHITVIGACADAPMRRCADAPMRRCADAPMRRCADAPMRRCADAPMRLRSGSRSNSATM
ncbi:hypothetical protein [Alicyclobacillus sp. ALC3]|uniref:hypothetical protein n=1 Tax=Alicyclobacillus sp. ALC3 TaxID=2796143 RepID=UPI002379BD89|nr:hypothetical protein [Alicyclobacillus sp. ALC3]WDL98202.1 hypothetical protein JC200_05745 [Alicyclobacillus sp. ALC3]